MRKRSSKLHGRQRFGCAHAWVRLRNYRHHHPRTSLGTKSEGKAERKSLVKVSWSWKKERKSLLVVLREEDFNMVMYDTQNQAALCCVDRCVTWLAVFRIVMRIMRTSRGPLAVSLEWFTTSQLH